MSLDVYLEGPEEQVACRCPDCEHEHTRPSRPCFFSANITHNLTGMADAAGLYRALWRPAELGVTTAGQLAPLIADGLTTLKADPTRFTTMNPPNGWGTHEGLVRFAEEYLAACREYPTALVRVWR